MREPSAPPAAAGLILAAGAGTRFGDAPSSWLRSGAGRCCSGRSTPSVRSLRRCSIRSWSCSAPTPTRSDRRSPGAGPVRSCARTGGWVSRPRCGRGLGELAAAGADGRVVITLGDAPLVSAAVIARFAGEPAPVRATYDGQRGHPVVLGPAERAAMTDVAGDQGARGLLSRARTIEIGHLCSGRDVDTPEELEEMRNAVRAVV